MENSQYIALLDLPNSKISPDQIAILTAMLEEKLSIKKLAVRFKLTPAQIKHAIYDTETGIRGRLIRYLDKQGKFTLEIPKHPEEWMDFLTEQGILRARE
jgi:hypothetical protein